MDQLDESDAQPKISQRQFWVMLFAAALLLTLLSVIYFQERSKEWHLRVEQSNHRLTLAEEIVARDLDRVRADLHFVAALPEVVSADAGDAKSLEGVAEVFEKFVASQKTYSQVRLVGRNGMEIARVDWDGVNSLLTRNKDLQDKSDRYYVTDSLELELGEFFTSEFDLNLEKGEIETPLKPVIRFVTPVNKNGQAGNLLVFNYHGVSLLNELSAILLPGKTYLIREDGEFLLGPSRDSEWGWLLDHSTRFSSLFGDVGLADLVEADNPIRSSHGIFLARKMQLGREDALSGETHLSLFCVAHIDQANAFESSQKLLYRLLLVGSIMLVPLALTTRFWAAAIDRRELQNRKIAESERRLRQLSAQLVGLQEDERRKLSREIHDSLGQQATAINLDLRMLKEKLPGSPELKRLIGESDELLKSLHGFATRVRPAELDDLGLKVALESHVSEFVSRTGIEAKLSVQLDDCHVDSSVATHVFRIVQEALTNIAKHSGATEASIELGLDRATNLLQVGVSDDGVGMESEMTATETDSNSKKRLGILGMRERVDLLNGKIKLTSSVGKGTRLDVSIPLPSSQNELQKEVR